MIFDTEIYTANINNIMYTGVATYLWCHWSELNTKRALEWAYYELDTTVYMLSYPLHDTINPYYDSHISIPRLSCSVHGLLMTPPSIADDITNATQQLWG